MAKILGKKISAAIIDSIAAYAENKELTIAALYAGDDPSTLSYIKSKQRQSAKAGIDILLVNKRKDVDADTFYKELKRLNDDNSINGIIVEKPLPAQIDIKTIASLINPCKDIDCMSYENNGRLLTDDFVIAPSTAMAVIHILKESNIEINRKHAVIIGRSEIVGKPLSLLLTSKQLDNHATVTLCHSRTADLEKILNGADIIIIAIGIPCFLKASMIGDNRPVLIDVGINYGKDGICGDIDPLCHEKASYFTPVPGGVGPVTVATLFHNLIKLNEKYG